LGQGRDAVKQLIEDNPELSEELEKKIKEKIGSGSEIKEEVEGIIQEVQD
jgi:recombination protein RecA